MDINDRRVKRTHQLLEQALTALILEKGYDAISIRDITERADIAYATFFRHYKDKEALLVTMVKEVIAELEILLQQRPDMTGVDEGFHVFRHVNENHTLYTILLNSQGAGKVLDKFQKVIARDIECQCEPARITVTASDIPLAIIANQTAAGVLSLIKWWLDNDRPYSVERMAEFYSELVLVPAWRWVFGDKTPREVFVHPINT